MPFPQMPQAGGSPGFRQTACCRTGCKIGAFWCNAWQVFRKHVAATKVWIVLRLLGLLRLFSGRADCRLTIRVSVYAVHTIAVALGRRSLGALIGFGRSSFVFSFPTRQAAASRNSRFRFLIFLFCLLCSCLDAALNQTAIRTRADARRGAQNM